MKYIIKDWAGNEIQTKSKSGLWIELDFPTFDDAWEYIFENFPEEDFEELFVVEK